MVVTIDGPAGAGKSSVSRALARRLGFHFLDTGAMYRAVVWAALERRVSWDDPDQLAALARNLRIEVTDDQVFVDGQDVTSAIRTSGVTAVIHYAADNVAVRSHLVELQRRTAEGIDLVTEGRDQGTVAFPDASCKIFLTASPAERAQRRLVEMTKRGEAATLDEVLAAQNERDRRDAIRPVGALVKAKDAIEVLTDGLSSEQVVDRLEAIARGARAKTN